MGGRLVYFSNHRMSHSDVPYTLSLFTFFAYHPPKLIYLFTILFDMQMIQDSLLHLSTLLLPNSLSKTLELYVTFLGFSWFPLRMASSSPNTTAFMIFSRNTISMMLNPVCTPMSTLVNISKRGNTPSCDSKLSQYMHAPITIHMQAAKHSFVT